ncbi:MAG: hypothetical protein QM770_04570 [Tepidisphaeraceae bacterium]
MKRLVDRPIIEVPVGKPVSEFVATAPTPNEPIRIVLGGRPYPGGCELLARAWPEIEAMPRKVELTYVGPHYASIPVSLRPMCKDAGFIADERAFRQFLARFHIAYVSGPDGLDPFGRFSFPSRAVDYMMAGLPLLAAVHEQSATSQVLSRVRGCGARLAATPADVRQGLEALTETAEAWSEGSHAVREYAVRTMSIERVRGQMEAAFDASCQRHA